MKSLIGKLTSSMFKQSPVILTGLVVAGLISTVVAAISATPKALELIKEAEEEKGEELTIPETVVVTWKEYIPTIIFGGLTIACAISSNTISTRRNAALAGLYSLSEKGYKEYKEKVAQKLSPQTDKEIKLDIIEDKMSVLDEDCVIYTGKGDTLCYDACSGRYFKSDIEVIKQALNRLGRDMLSEHYITLNQVYDELNLSHTKLGEFIGWHIDDGSLEGSYSSLLTEKGTPCLVLDFTTDPRYGYSYS